MSTIRIATKLTKNLRLDYIKSTLDANWKYFVSKKQVKLLIRLLMKAVRLLWDS